MAVRQIFVEDNEYMFRKRNEEENEEQILCSDRSWAVRDDGSLTLAEANCDVLAIDDKDDNVQDIAEKFPMLSRQMCVIREFWNRLEFRT